ncbi:MAG: TRAP transporter small permease [Alphaproteobacteria bacterium]|nr:TRAP transporter small permease [Alphaproteobacteria bacterium]
MAGAVETGALGPFDRALAQVENGLNLVSAAAIFVLMFIGVVQVVGRSLFGYAIHGYIDWIEQSSVLVAFLGVAYCQRLGGHVRMEVVLQNLPRRAMWVLEAIGILLALVIVGMLVYSTFLNFQRAYQLGDSTMDIRLPIWPAKLVVPIALGLLWLRLLVQLIGYGRLVRRPELAPLGVPTIHSAAEQAREEIAESLGRADARRD